MVLSPSVHKESDMIETSQPAGKEVSAASAAAAVDAPPHRLQRPSITSHTSLHHQGSLEKWLLQGSGRKCTR